MHLIEFVATEHVSGELEYPDFDMTVDKAEAFEMAAKEVRFIYPEYDNIEIVGIKEV